MENKTFINPFMDKIIESFKKKYPGYKIGDYEEIDGGIQTPAIFIQLLNFEGVGDKFNDIFRINCTFRAYAVESFKGKAKRRVRDTALDISNFIDKNDWENSNTFNKAQFTYSAEDEFNEKIDSAEIWYVEWEQQVYFK